MAKEKQEVYTIYYDADAALVVMNWHGYSTSAQFREGTELMLNLIIKHSCRKVLADISDMTIIGLEDRQWMESSFLPRAIKFGFRAIAIITPTSYFNKVAVEDISYKIDKEKLTLHFFDNIEDGTKWIKDLALESLEHEPAKN